MRHVHKFSERTTKLVEYWLTLHICSVHDKLKRSQGSASTVQDSVSVVGYPTGGESLSVTQGVVSRIDLVEHLGTQDLDGFDSVSNI